MRWQDYISANPNICHGKACVTGTRVMVSVILDGFAEGLTVEEIVEHYPSVSREAAQATLLYAAELAKEGPRKPLGQWLLENIPRGANLTIPDRDSKRKTP